MLEWNANETLAVARGSAVQQFHATIGNDQLETEVAPWGEGHLKVNGRETSYVDKA
jgi:enoyl-[acyl-carrier protein] reductase I